MNNVDDKIIERIQKLLNLAAKNPNEAEAALAAAKAQELLTEHGLSTATIERAQDAKAGKREQAMVDGGTYAHQRELWKAVARLNNCWHWVQPYQVWSNSKRVGTGRERWTTQGYVWKNRHVLVGRIVNVTATKVMAAYLQEAIERATMERLGLRHGIMLTGKAVSSDLQAQRFSNWAVSFRKGAARRVLEQLQDRAEAQEEAFLKKQREDQARAERAGISTATGLTIADVRQAEYEANHDFIYGAGAWAKKQEARRKRAEEERLEEEAYTKWAAEHPEEAAAKEAERRKESRRHASRGGSGPRDNIDTSAYWSGYDEAAKISLEQQVDKAAKAAGLLK